MKTLSLDLETYSSVDLGKSSVYRYVESPDFDILLLGYSADGGEVQVVDLAQGEQIPTEVIDALTDECVCKWAFNAQFERVCLSRWLRRNGYPLRNERYAAPDDPCMAYLNPAGWHCTMVWSAYLGLPLSLKDVGAALGLDKQKLTEGKELIRYFCVPGKDGTRHVPASAPEKWVTFKAYNLRDVETEMSIQDRLRKYPVPEEVWAQYHLDQQINDDKELIYTFEVAVYPEVVLGQYKGLEVPQNHETFDESKVDEEMLNVQKRNARLIDVEREAKLGDHATIDFAGFIDGEQFDGGTAENYDIELGSNTFVPGFEEQIVGMKAGDERDVVVTFPENYVAELAGKEATFKVTVKSVKEPELPELDDELAKDISDYETIAEYRDHVREDLEKQFNEEQESDYATRLMKAAVDNMTVEIPEPMVLAKLDEQLRNYISTMGVSPELTREQVLASMGLDEKTFQEIMRPQAMFEISTDLLLDAIVKAENIELDEGELDEMYQKMADEYKMEVDQIKQYVDEKIIVLDMKRRKAAQLIRDTAVDKEPEAKEEPAEAKEEAAE